MKKEDAFLHYLVKNRIDNKNIFEFVSGCENYSDIMNKFNLVRFDKERNIDSRLAKFIIQFEHDYSNIIETEKLFFMELLQKSIQYTTILSDNYPKRLLNIIDPPAILYYKGNLPEENLPTVAIVGARECSDYGRRIARQFAKEFGYNGIQVISGLARGIDGISHRESIIAKGKTFGILGNGVDVIYPSENNDIYENILENGGIISEFEPGEQPLQFHFPMRNRIISGLADVLLVVEARKRSGTLITVNQALEQGKEVYAVPGRITDSLSDSCNSLIKDGCNVALDPIDIIINLKDKYEISRSVEFSENNESLWLYNLINEEARGYEELVNACGGKEEEIFEQLLMLQMDGKIYKNYDKYYVV